jgi:hypothetical protein
MMHPNYSKKLLTTLIAGVLSLLTYNAIGADYEITPYVGYNFSDDLSTTSASDDTSLGLAFSWKDGPSGQGSVLVNYVSHDYKDSADNTNHSFDIIYTHFSGIALFRQQNYVTTLSLGIGGAYFDTASNSDIYPSLTAAIGTRYEFSEEFALVTELRGYASLTDKDNDLFCEDTVCSAKFEDATWVETNLSVGIAYRF